MDTKWKKSKMVIGVITWFAGMVLFAINMFGLLLEMGYQEHFAEYAGRILHGDYEDTEEFSDFIRYRMSDFLAMSVADDMEDMEKKREAMEREETYGAETGYDGGTKYQYYDFYADYGMERYDVVYDGRWRI